MTEGGIISLGVAGLSLIAIPFGHWVVKTLNLHSDAIGKHSSDICDLQKDRDSAEHRLDELIPTMAKVVEGIEWIKREIRK